MKNIGGSFGDEIQKAGLGGLPFSWGGDGSFHFGASMSPAQIAAVQAIYDTHDPTKKSPRQEIADLLASAGAKDAGSVEGLMAGVLALGLIQGLTEEQLYAVNPGYRVAKDMVARINELKAQL